MATGDVTGAKRPRYQANERFDSGDADAASRAPRDHGEAFQRAILTTPRAAAGAVMPGLIINGFGLTLNPAAAPNIVQVTTELAVAIDANGRYIVKPAGITIDVTIPAGPHQVYAYYQETPADTATRRFLTVVSPFTEYAAAMSTTFQSTYGVHVRSGDNTNTVKDDVINGITTPLVCIGIVNNAAGTILCTGYHAVTAPNGSDIINRIATVSAPTTTPTVNTRNGSLQTIHDAITAALYTAGQTAWKGSDYLTPAAANNFGAYNIPAGGADKAFRQALGWLTIGDGVTSIGDFNTADYANCKLMLDAALAALPAVGGKLILKKGVTLSGFGGTTVTLPANKAVEIIGTCNHQGIAVGTPQITFVAGEKFICNTAVPLTLRDLYIRHVDTAVTITNISTGGFRAYNTVFEKPNGTDSGGALQGVDVQNMHLEDVTFISDIDAPGDTVAMAVRVTGVARRITFNNVTHNMIGDDHASILLTDIREDVRLIDVTCIADAAFTSTAFPYCVQLGTTDNTTDIQNRVVKNLTLSGPHTRGFSPGEVGHLLVDGLVTQGCLRSVVHHTASTWTGKQLFRDCRFYMTSDSVACLLVGTPAMGPLEFEHCEFRATGFANALCGYFSGNGAHKFLSFQGCTFDGFAPEASWASPLILVLSVAMEVALFDGNVITNWGNLAYAGAAAGTTFPSMFRVEGSAQLVTCRRNVVKNITAGSTGNTRNQPYLLSTAGYTGNTISRVVVTDNEIGTTFTGSADVCGLWNNVDCTIANWDVSRNHVRITWNDGVGGVTWLGGSMIRATSTTTNFGYMNSGKFDGNQVEITNGSNTDIVSDLVFLDNTGVALIGNLSIQGNTLFHDSSSKKFDYAAAWGINIPSYTTSNLAVAGNNCSSGDMAFLPDAWRIRFTGAVTNQINDVTPGAGVAVAGNNGLFGNA